MKTPLFLFPGLACNENLYTAQKYGLENIVNVIVPPWIRPTSKDQLHSFALRWAEFVWETYYSEKALPENRQNPALGCYIGGHSFGGALAPIIGEFLESKGIKIHGCFQMASPSKAQDIPSKWRWLGRFLNIFPDGTWLLIKTFCYLRIRFSSRQRFSHEKEVFYRQVVASPARRSFHVVRMIYSWKEEKQEHKYNFPMLRVRGGNDSLCPPSKNYEAVILPHSGHGMMLTQSAKLNDLIRNFIFSNT